MDTVEIIPAQEKYIKAYWVTLGRVAQERKYLRITHAFPLEETMEFIREGIKNNYPYFFIKSEDAIVGWCDIRPLSKESTVGCLGIGLLKDYRGQGIGAKAIAVALNKAREQSFTLIQLEVLATNERAIRLYRSAGFLFAEQSPRLIEIEGEKAEIYTMQLQLS